MQVRRMRGKERGQTCEVERVHARRMRGGGDRPNM